jgi:hypothetical protein
MMADVESDASNAARHSPSSSGLDDDNFINEPLIAPSLKKGQDVSLGASEFYFSSNVYIFSRCLSPWFSDYTGIKHSANGF